MASLRNSHVALPILRVKGHTTGHYCSVWPPLVSNGQPIVREQCSSINAFSETNVPPPGLARSRHQVEMKRECCPFQCTPAHERTAAPLPVRQWPSSASQNPQRPSFAYCRRLQRCDWVHSITALFALSETVGILRIDGVR